MGRSPSPDATEPASAETLLVEWDKRGIEAATLVPSESGTIAAPYNSTSPDWSDVLDLLPEAVAATAPTVVIEDEIGRGGMGVVRAGRQQSLGREVALKSIRDPEDFAATQALLREAWITGQLEHPNVIPVYALYRDGLDPLLMMKRVEGSSWSDILADPERRGDLEANLRVLIQICHAVHYAHSRGFLHLDLKPDNVMIGEFGETYLLDWGIAVSVDDRQPAFIPRAIDISHVVGTPGYMAPELAAGDGGSIDPRTDVYLLGAVLYEILVGERPHGGKTMVERLESSFRSDRPRWPAGVPAGLAAIAEKAMARDPSDRYATVAELREAIEDYLVHSDSLALAAAARERLDKVIENLGGTAFSHPGDVERLASEAAFGFRQALHVWPGNDEARAGLQTLLERLIESDLDRKRWRVASRRLVDLPEPRPDLKARVDELRAADVRQADELRQLRDDADLGKAARQRSAMAFIGAFLWLVSLVGLGVLDKLGAMDVSHPHLFALTAGATGIFSLIVFSTREQLFANAVNRAVVGLLAVGWFFGTLYWVSAWIVDADFESAVIGIGPLIALVIAAGAVTVDRRLIPHMIVSIIGAIIHPLFPAYGLEVLGVTGGVVLGMLGFTWLRQAPSPSSSPGAEALADPGADH